MTSASIALSDQGLVLGAGSVLARMITDGHGAGRLALDADGDRLLALVSVAAGRPVAGTDILRHVKAAAEHWQRGDKALANLRLVFGRLPRLREPEDAYRLCLAEYLLDEGLAPAALLNEIGLQDLNFDKYDPDQPRVPSGVSGGGQWTFGPVSTSGGRGAPFEVASEGGPPEDEKTYKERRSLDETTPDEDVAHGRDVLHLDALPKGIGPGPYAGRSVPAGPSPRPTGRQREEMTVIGRETGCHTCGTKDPGTDSGLFYCDHQYPTALNLNGRPQVYYPHCMSCSCKQGGLIKSYRGRH